MTFDLCSIGHSNIPADRFVGMLQSAGVDAIADVRSVPLSRFFPWFSGKPLAARLADAGIGYAAMGEALGGRPRSDGLYRNGVADYEAMAARPEFLRARESLIEGATRSRICLLCAERDPLDCHRFLLVSRRLAERGLTIGHILHDGRIEPHDTTEQRMLALDDEDCDLFAAGQAERLAAAYRRRAQAVAFRQKVPAPSGAAEK
jgi:uncharacterized protein (DUF488 family)